MRYRLAIFDFDGTLADTFPWFRRVWNEVAEHFHLPRMTDAEIEALRTLDGHGIITQLGVPVWKLPLIARHVRQLMAKEVGQLSLFPGVDPLLHDLAAHGVRLAIVSSNSLANVRAILGAPNADLIQHYECGAAIFGKRPKLRRVLREMGVRPGEAICIGDEVRDLEAAHAEGFDFGAVAWGYTQAAAFARHRPKWVFDRVEEIAAALIGSAPG
jgi:phosphoglycolate phosphatase